MGDNSIFSVFSNIWSSVRLKIPPRLPSIPSFLVPKIVYIEYGQFTKNDSFSFLPFHSYAPCIFISYCCLCQCVIIICRWPQNFIERSLSRIFFFIEICCQKWQKCNTISVTTFFYWISIEFQGFVKIKINIYTRILDIMKL